MRTTDITKPSIDWQAVPFCVEVPSDLSKYALKTNDIVVSRAGSVGFSKLLTEVPESTVFASYLIRFKPSNAVDPRYVAAYLKSPQYWRDVGAASVGIALANVNATKLASLCFPLAPLREQHRIANKLDEVLAHVDACRARLDNVVPLLKRFRQSVLSAATSGRLTAGHDWADVPLGSVLEGKPRNGYSPKAVSYPTAVRSLTLSATTSGRFKGEHCKFIDEDIPSSSHLWLEPGDVLIQRANSLEYVGVSAIFNGEARTFIYPDLMMRARPQPNRMLAAFMHIVLSSEPARKYFRDNATGTAGNMPKINQQTVMSLPIRLPPLDEQAEVVHRVETLFAFADRLEARLQQAQAATHRLTPALLAKAFRGELVPQDPADEPAVDLLKRIVVPTKKSSR